MKLIKEKEDIFFRLLNEQMELVSGICSQYYDLLHDFTEIEAKSQKIKEMETKCDHKVHEIVAELNRAFITPFDREDIFQIVQTLDDIADTVEVAAYWFVVYNIDTLREGIVEMSEVLDRTVRKLIELFEELPKFRKTVLIKELCIDIHALENENDEIYRSCLYKLFRDENVSTLDIIKWKQLYKLIEDAVDVCSSVAQITERTVMKHV